MQFRWITSWFAIKFSLSSMNTFMKSPSRFSGWMIVNLFMLLNDNLEYLVLSLLSISSMISCSSLLSLILLRCCVSAPVLSLSCSIVWMNVGQDGLFCSACLQSSRHLSLLVIYFLWALGWWLGIVMSACIRQWSERSVHLYWVECYSFWLHSIQSVMDWTFFEVLLKVICLLPKSLRCLIGWVLVLKSPVIMIVASGLIVWWL